MALTAPWRQHNYMGQCASDAAALTFIQNNEWDSNGNGTGNPQAGMVYYNTADAKLKVYTGSQWDYIGDLAFAGTMREFILTDDQLDTTDGINAAAAVTFSSQPVSGDVITLTDGTTTRTYGADSGGDVQFAIGVDAATTMANFAAAVEGDGSSIWGAVYSEVLDAIAAGVVYIVEDANSGTAPRIYGTWGTQANCQIVDYTGEYNYSKKSTSNLPSADPTTSNFGFRRTAASLQDGELHYCANEDYLYGWDDDNNQWNQMSGGGSIPDATAASGGGTKGKVTADSDYGLAISSGIMTINASASGGLGFSTGALVIVPDTNTETTVAVSANGLRVTGLPLQFNINDAATSTDVTATALNALTSASNDVGATYHDHDSIYYTETEIGSSVADSEGASLVGTDTKTNLNSATTVEVALTYLDTQNSPRRYTNAGNPNGTVTASAVGDLCIDTTNNVLYYATATGTDNWMVS